MFFKTFFTKTYPQSTFDNNDAHHILEMNPNWPKCIENHFLSPYKYFLGAYKKKSFTLLFVHFYILHSGFFYDKNSYKDVNLQNSLKSKNGHVLHGSLSKDEFSPP